MTYRLSVITALFTLLAVCGFAQTDTTTTAPCPQYSSGAFLGFNHYDTPQIKGGAFFDAKVAENMYNETTLNMTSKLATVTMGVKRFSYTTSTVGLFATAKAGVATGDGSATAVFAGGGGIKVLLETAIDSTFLGAQRNPGEAGIVLLSLDRVRDRRVTDLSLTTAWALRNRHL